MDDEGVVAAHLQGEDFSGLVGQGAIDGLAGFETSGEENGVDAGVGDESGAGGGGGVGGCFSLLF